VVSNTLKKEFPALLQEGLAADLAAAIGAAFDGDKKERMD
jgi:molecular chaperone DnaK (HSP70)